MSTVISKTFKTLMLEVPAEGVLHVALNRPERYNAINPQMWADLRSCFEEIKFDNTVNSVILSGNGKSFCSGLDLKGGLPISPALALDSGVERDVARKAFYSRFEILDLQASMTAIEKCLKPVFCLIDNACIGAGVDMSTACDVRYCTEDAFFSIKEVDIGMAADVGTLQRLPKVVSSESWARELAFTARRATSDEALQFGLVSRVFSTRSEMFDFAISIAAQVAAKSPVAVVSTKMVMNYSRDHSVDEGLEHVALWNTLMHNTDDIKTAIAATLAKKTPKFSKL
ncbi:Delta(3,5)-Delta(2,4)-dienoyl-CoA isomerase, mitochondrial [Smittium mucronatum]|uniref:Delta(3,5)-Delta(2,4)-dienoyl-CoA isomerase, mitochondrial n=1 Tax=Smittium mucronatum TaxID=133383 RepID=A0A1R0H5L6_9FUNG|nr:Delta(3,5)-Delta(2,4)-dienoyl-CoA isomerase, mitochondrial [Smittium mucronatum]